MANLQNSIQGNFFNSINESGEDLKRIEKKVYSQAERILWFFEINKGADFTPYQVKRLLFKTSPITSIRRAITDLTSEGKLIKLDKKRKGQYGLMNYCWTYNDNQ